MLCCLTPFHLISSESYAKQALPLPFVPAGSVPGFLSGSGYLEQLSEEISWKDSRLQSTWCKLRAQQGGFSSAQWHWGLETAGLNSASVYLCSFIPSQPLSHGSEYPLSSCWKWEIEVGVVNILMTPQPKFLDNNRHHVDVKKNGQGGGETELFGI